MVYTDILSICYGYFFVYLKINFHSINKIYEEKGGNNIRDNQKKKFKGYISYHNIL
jgi:hypothetical protein